ncbi:serine threonine sps1 [Moniliophthora roreri MCA 2997]|uniref:Serine threonine sps1 n=2 Tax=Moniliophthora roreri TaxID=221103 RepID=V2WEX9_MONRO|nr:serine threonine sps1 [Moniliophthora roreri MCA 2997]KAI3621588.1 serine threonine sps1 [Moniliophthora roreri]
MQDPATRLRKTELLSKFVIPSQLPPPSEEALRLGVYRSPEDIVRCQCLACTGLSELQGFTLPRFFESHKVVMPWGETALLSVLEVVPLRLDKLYHTLEDSGVRLSNFVHIYLNLFKEGVAIIDAAHRKHIHHLDIHEDRHFDGCRVVLIDWRNDKALDEGSLVKNDQALGRRVEELNLW